MGLSNFQDVEKWNLDGTPPGEATFWALNKDTVIMMIIIDVLIIIFAYLATKSLKAIPGKLQSAFEMLIITNNYLSHSLSTSLAIKYQSDYSLQRMQVSS